MFCRIIQVKRTNTDKISQTHGKSEIYNQKYVAEMLTMQLSEIILIKDRSKYVPLNDVYKEGKYKNPTEY